MFFLWENIINIKKVNNKKIILLSFKRFGFIVPTTFSRIVATAKTVREENIDDLEEANNRDPFSKLKKLLFENNFTEKELSEFAKIAFSVLDLNYENYIKIDKKLYRPTVVSNMISDSSKIRNKLKWESKTNFENLVSEMVISDYNALKDN